MKHVSDPAEGRRDQSNPGIGRPWAGVSQVSNQKRVIGARHESIKRRRDEPYRTPTAALATPRPESSHPDEPPPKRAKTRNEIVAERYGMEPSTNYGLERLNTAKPDLKSMETTKLLERRQSLSEKDVSRGSLPTNSVPMGLLKVKRHSGTYSKPSSPVAKSTSADRRSISKQPSMSVAPSPVELPCRASDVGPRSARKTAQPTVVRRGPALKRAGAFLQTVPSESESDSDNPERKAAAEKLKQQKKRTKKHQERAEKATRELEATEKAKKTLEEQVKELQEKLAQLSKEKKPQAAADVPKAASPQKYLSRREMYSDWDFSHSAPLTAPKEAPSPPEPAPGYYPSEKSWRKSKYRAWDQSRLMNIHVHRQREARSAGPGFTAKIKDHPLESEPGAGDGSNKSIVHFTHRKPSMFNDFASIPRDAIPLVKDGSLGFKAGTIVSYNRPQPFWNASF